MLVYFMPIWKILCLFCKLYGHLEILWQFGIFSPVLVYCVKKNLATLSQRGLRPRWLLFKDTPIISCAEGPHFDVGITKKRSARPRGAVGIKNRRPGFESRAGCKVFRNAH
jgi:hypothetical protein